MGGQLTGKLGYSKENLPLPPTLSIKIPTWGALKLNLDLHSQKPVNLGYAQRTMKLLVMCNVNTVLKDTGKESH